MKMKIAHIRLVSFLPTKTGFEKKVGYITIGCESVSPGWNEKDEVNCRVSISYCQPGVTFKKSHGSSAITTRINRMQEGSNATDPLYGSLYGDKFYITATKRNWLNKILNRIANNERGWVRRAIWAWQHDISWVLDATGYEVKGVTMGDLTTHPVTFLKGAPVRKSEEMNLATPDDLPTGLESNG